MAELETPPQAPPAAIDPSAEPPEGELGKGGSLLDRLREKREALAEDRAELFEVPGYNGDLWVRLRVVDWAVLRRIARKAEASKNERAELYAQADTLAAACVEVLGPDEQALDPDAILQFDDNLAALLGFEADTARDVVLGVFNGNDLGLSALFAEWQAWAQRNSRVLDEDLAGN